MEAFIPVNDAIDETKLHRLTFDRHHSSSIGGFSYTNFDEETEELQHSNHIRKASRVDISQSFAWSMSSETCEENGDGAEGQAFDDERQDARQRLMTEDNIGRERLQSIADDRFDHKDGSARRHEQLSHERPARVAAAFRAASCPNMPSLDAYSPAQVAACFRAGSCPTMPSLDSDRPTDPLDPSERVQPAIRRTRAFTDDSFDLYSGNHKVRRFKRSDSILIDSCCGSTDLSIRQERPTAIWVYWGEHLDVKSPFTEQQQF
jgi:hypothetical protein